MTKKQKVYVEFNNHGEKLDYDRMAEIAGFFTYNALKEQGLLICSIRFDLEGDYVERKEAEVHE